MDDALSFQKHPLPFSASEQNVSDNEDDMFNDVLDEDGQSAFRTQAMEVTQKRKRDKDSIKNKRSSKIAKGGDLGDSGTSDKEKTTRRIKTRSKN